MFSIIQVCNENVTMLGEKIQEYGGWPNGDDRGESALREIDLALTFLPMEVLRFKYSTATLKGDGNSLGIFP